MLVNGSATLKSNDGNFKVRFERPAHSETVIENPNNGTAFCIEGTSDGTKSEEIFESNKAFLNQIYTACDDNEYGFNCPGIVYATLNQAGYVSVTSDNPPGGYCVANQWGDLRCSG